MLKDGNRTAAVGTSSIYRIHLRICARSAGSAGVSGTSGKTSSRYSQMTLESMMTTPSCTRVGTTPFGLIFR